MIKGNYTMGNARDLLQGRAPIGLGEGWNEKDMTGVEENCLICSKLMPDGIYQELQLYPLRDGRADYSSIGPICDDCLRTRKPQDARDGVIKEAEYWLAAQDADSEFLELHKENWLGYVGAALLLRDSSLTWDDLRKTEGKFKATFKTQFESKRDQQQDWCEL